MHTYLKSIGFPNIENTGDLEILLRDVLEHYDRKRTVELEGHHILTEISKEYAYDCGIAVCGEFDEENRFHMEYYYPYFWGGQISSYEEVTVERHAGMESYAGACDDLRLGITMIFYLINSVDYLSRKNSDLLQELNPPLILSGLAKEGCILLPVKKNAVQMEQERKTAKQKNSLLQAARSGDEEAMESLTMDDIDTYAMISRRLEREDVFSIVENYFMPYGLECDQYSVLGDILEVNTTENSRTGEKLYQMSLVCNDIPLDVCIRADDLTGEPEVGRRFKGQIWLQGMLEY